MLKKFFQNTRKPEGTMGSLMVNMMNKGHAPLSAWGLSHLPKNPAAKALDIGCGGGANVSALLSLFPQGSVTGVDYSPVCVRRSAALNQAAIRQGRCRILQGDASALPFEAGTFQAVTAFETIYFWPGLPSCFAGIYKILQPGGVFLICNEEADPENDRWSRIVDGMTVYGEGQLASMLRDAGFSHIQADQEKKKGWLCILAQKAKAEE